MNNIGYFINYLIILMISKEGCRYCELSKELLEEYNMPYHVLQYNDITKPVLDLAYHKLYDDFGHETFPAIFINGQFLGGYNELKEYLIQLNKALVAG